jgi:G:T-mismatch repair DNA endonuclease (very short patch repair protein)
MINKIVLCQNDAQIIEKKKLNGRRCIYLLSNGDRVDGSKIYGQRCNVYCSNIGCTNYNQISLYSGKSSPLNKKYECFYCRSLGKRNPFYGKKHSEESIDKIRDSKTGMNTGEKNYFFQKNMWETYTEQESKEIKQKISDSVTGFKNPFYNKTHTDEARKTISRKNKQYLQDHPEALERLKQQGIKSIEKQSKGLKTSIEKIVEEELIRRNIKYKYSKILHRKYQYDFIIGDDILLEVMGDYWHGNPLIYGNESGKRKLSERQKFKVQRDEEKKAFAEKYGYKMWYIWESEIKNSNFVILDKIVVELSKDK